VLSTQPQVVILPRKETLLPSFDKAGTAILRISESRAQRRTTVDQWQKIERSLMLRDDVAVVSPTATGPAFVYHGATVRSISLIGIVPETYYRYVKIPDYIIRGGAQISGSVILVGKDLADDLGIKVEDKVLVNTSSGASSTLNVRGIFDFGNKGFNSRSIFTTLSTAQGMLGIVGEVTSVDVTLHDPYGANAVADAAAALFPVEADSWIRTNAQFFTAIRSQNASSTMIRLSVGLSVALGIASVLAVSVTQRSREIGILRAMGATRGQIMRLFLLQGGLVALVGSLIGSGIARLVLALWLNFARNPDGTSFFAIAIPFSLYVEAAVLAAACGVLAAVVPALRASRLDPVEAIRG
jgi:lipoprotein-releasing system permease protein